jgi:hypothetical protein
VVRLLRPVLGGQIEVTMSSPADAMMAVADPGLLMAAVLKLAIVAGNAMPDGGRISMAAAAAGGEASDGGVVDEAIEIKVGAVSSIKSGCFLVSGAGDLGPVDELVRLSGGTIAVEPHVDRVGFQIRLRKADSVIS